MKKCDVDSESEDRNDVPVVTYSIPRILLNNTCSVIDDDLSVCPNLNKPDLEKCDNIIEIFSHRKLYIAPGKRKSTLENNDETKKNIRDEDLWNLLLIGKYL